MTSLEPLGDRAFLARFETERQAASWAAQVRAGQWAGIVDIVPAYRTVAVFADPKCVHWDELALLLRQTSAEGETPSLGRLIALPVLYEGEDLTEVAQLLGLTVAEVIAAHSATDYSVFAIGFLPGFPYAGYLPEGLAGLPRRASPRTRVPAGSVAIAGRQTGVYPAPSPGGWHLLGRTPLKIVDVARGHFPIRAGDRLRFVPIDAPEFEARQGDLLS